MGKVCVAIYANTGNEKRTCCLSSRRGQEESSWDETQKETRKQFAARLRRTALSLPRSDVLRAMKSLPKRIRKVSEAGGRHIALD